MKFRHLTVFTSLLFAIFSSLCQIGLAANLGGALTYEYVSGTTLRVRHSTYRACDGTSPSAPSNVAFVGIGSGCTLPASTGWTALPVVEITALSPQIATTCTNPLATLIGMEEWRYERNYDFSGMNCTRYKLQWSDCCRDAGLDNLVSSGIGIGIQADTIRLPLLAGNNSPVWRTAPPRYAIVNRGNRFDLSAYDPDGDSLSYKFVQPFDASFQPIGYNSGYSVSQPLGTTWSAGIENVTGMLSLSSTAAVPGKAALAIEVTEHRNGIPIGHLRRDFVIEMVTTLPGLSQVPAVSPVSVVSGAKSFYSGTVIVVPRGASMCVEHTALDPDPGDGSLMTWMHNLAGATFSDNLGTVTDSVMGIAPTARLCWTAPDSFAVTGYTICAADTSCQWNNFNYDGNPVLVGDTAAVWPGDVDNDRSADAFDLLGIGQAFGQVRYARVLPTINWGPEECLPWQDTIIGGFDYKYCDSNGDGTVNLDDTLAIHNNYGSTHNKAALPVQRITGVFPPLRLLLPDSADAGDTIHADVELGDGLISADNVYGFAFAVQYDAALIDTSTIWVDFSGSWVAPGGNVATMQHHDRSDGTLEASLVRTTQTTVSGQGVVARIHFVIIDNIDGKTETYLDSAQFKMFFTETIVIGLDSIISTDIIPDSMMVFDSLVGRHDPLPGVEARLYPNPVQAHGGAPRVRLEVEGTTILGVEITPIQGQILASIGGNGQSRMLIETQSLPAGMYFLRIHTPLGTMVRKLVVE